MPPKPVPLNQLPRTEVSGGAASIVAGAILAAAAYYMWMVAIGDLKLQCDPPPPGILYYMATALTCLSIGQFVQWFRGLRRASNRKEIERTRPNEPWLADYPWNPSGIHDDNPRRIRFRIQLTIAVVLFFVPWNYFVFSSEGHYQKLEVTTVVIDLALALLLGIRRNRIAEYWKFGRSYLRFGEFPMRIGEEIVLRFCMNWDLHLFDSLEFRLRFVEERTVKAGKNSYIGVFEVYGEDHVVDTETLQNYRGEVEVRFHVPDLGYRTQLSTDPVRYWELAVKADGKGIDFAAAFLLPVYLSSWRKDDATTRRRNYDAPMDVAKT